MLAEVAPEARIQRGAHVHDAAFADPLDTVLAMRGFAERILALAPESRPYLTSAVAAADAALLLDEDHEPARSTRAWLATAHHHGARPLQIVSGRGIVYAIDCPFPITIPDEIAIGKLPPHGLVLWHLNWERLGPFPLVHVTREEFLVGRLDTADLHLVDATMARRHVRFQATADGFTSSDAGSPAGYWVDNTRVVDPHVLTVGEVLAIGSQRFLVLRNQPLR